MSRDEALQALEEIRKAMLDKFADETGVHAGRLGQLEGALATAAMAVEHLHDEEERQVDLAKRYLARAKVHGNDEVHLSSGMPLEHVQLIAGRG